MILQTYQRATTQRRYSATVLRTPEKVGRVEIGSNGRLHPVFSKDKAIPQVDGYLMPLAATGILSQMDTQELCPR